MGFQLHETMYGKNFFEHQLPALIRAINRLADVDEKRQAAEPAAVMKSNTVYVCYEENSHELAIEDGAVNELYVASSLDEVYRWVDKQQKNAEQNFYTVLNNEEESEFYKKLCAGSETALGLYHNGDESSRLFYTLTVKPMTSAGSFFRLWEARKCRKSSARRLLRRLFPMMKRNSASDTILQRRFWMTALRICWLPCAVGQAKAF